MFWKYVFVFDQARIYQRRKMQLTTQQRTFVVAEFSRTNSIITLTLTIIFEDLEHYVLSFDDLIHLALQIHNVQNVVPVPDDFFNQNPLGGENNPIVIFDTDEEDEILRWTFNSFVYIF